MSLSTREQQALDSIKNIHVGSQRAVRRSRPEPRHTRRPYQRPGLQQAVMLLWLVTTVAVIAIALACNHGGGQGTCTESWATICTGATSAPHPVLDIP